MFNPLTGFPSSTCPQSGIVSNEFPLFRIFSPYFPLKVNCSPCAQHTWCTRTVFNKTLNAFIVPANSFSRGVSSRAHLYCRFISALALQGNCHLALPRILRVIFPYTLAAFFPFSVWYLPKVFRFLFQLLRYISTTFSPCSGGCCLLESSDFNQRLSQQPHTHIPHFIFARTGQSFIQYVSIAVFVPVQSIRAVNVPAWIPTNLPSFAFFAS